MGYCRPSCLLLVSTGINPTNPGADSLRYSRSTTYNVHGTQGHGFPCKDFLRTTAKLFPETKSTNPQSPRRRPDKTDKTVSFANPLTTSPNRLPLQNRSPNHNSIHDSKRKNLCLSSKLPNNHWLEKSPDNSLHFPLLHQRLVFSRIPANKNGRPNQASQRVVNGRLHLGSQCVVPHTCL
jgi:hypothetical protein